VKLTKQHGKSANTLVVPALIPDSVRRREYQRDVNLYVNGV